MGDPEAKRSGVGAAFPAAIDLRERGDAHEGGIRGGHGPAGRSGAVVRLKALGREQIEAAMSEAY